jgi:uncharacterized protein YccT (UPF0319 family)
VTAGEVRGSNSVVDVVQPQMDEVYIRLLQLRELKEAVEAVAGPQVARVNEKGKHVKVMKRMRCDSVETLIEKKFKK